MMNDAAQATRILRDRARLLARAPEQVSDSLLEVLEFRLGAERYAVETPLVGEVYPLRDLTPLPCTPPFVRGIVNLRGHILPVLDLKRLFDLPEQELTDQHCIIVVRGGALEFGLLADVIVGVRSIPMESLQTSLPTLTGIRDEYLKGVTADRLLVLDLASIVADPKIVIHQEIDD
ncbi:MAG: chemotaxis protein CheW [Alphaproteobacteria bacterium]|nr:chemotaxis protein CheW [Alphaproteobacteria bacterium]